jgi:hypothetical protein
MWWAWAKAFGPVTWAWKSGAGRISTRRNDISQYSFDLDAAWLVDNDTQLDGGVNIGLNRATPGSGILFGIARF